MVYISLLLNSNFEIHYLWLVIKQVLQLRLIDLVKMNVFKKEIRVLHVHCFLENHVVSDLL